MNDPPTTHPCCDRRVPADHGVRAFVVRHGVAHVAARLAMDFADVTERAVFGLLSIEDRTVRSLSIHDLSQAWLYIVETAQSRLEGTSAVRGGETLISSATISGEAVQLRCGRFRVRMTDLRLIGTEQAI